MKRAFFVFLSAITIFFRLSPFCSAVPGLISYQGVLNDANGNPINNTALEMTFSIYDVETGGLALWSESQSVQVSGGVFSVKLGSVQELPSSLFHKDGLYLGIQVGTDAQMMPRQRLTSSPYAQKAALIAPVGSISAWAGNFSSKATGRVTSVTAANVLIDENAAFDSTTFWPGMCVAELSLTDSAYTCSSKIMTLSDSQSDGYLIPKILVARKEKDDNNGHITIIFYYTDGTTNSQSELIQGIYLSNKYYENPFVEKKVWKIDVLASNVCVGEFKAFISDSAQVRSVASTTQLTLNENLFKTNANFAYSIYGTPQLPDNWVECNGQTITDPESWYYGQAMPDLNANRSFLSGSSDVYEEKPGAVESFGNAGTDYNRFSVVWIMRIK